jgi:hypothetical protein
MTHIFQVFTELKRFKERERDGNNILYYYIVGSIFTISYFSLIMALTVTLPAFGMIGIGHGVEVYYLSNCTNNDTLDNNNYNNFDVISIMNSTGCNDTLPRTPLDFEVANWFIVFGASFWFPLCPVSAIYLLWSLFLMFVLPFDKVKISNNRTCSDVLMTCSNYTLKITEQCVWITLFVISIAMYVVLSYGVYLIYNRSGDLVNYSYEYDVFYVTVQSQFYMMMLSFPALVFSFSLWWFQRNIWCQPERRFNNNIRPQPPPPPPIPVVGGSKFSKVAKNGPAIQLDWNSTLFNNNHNHSGGSSSRENNSNHDNDSEVNDEPTKHIAKYYHNKTDDGVNNNNHIDLEMAELFGDDTLPPSPMVITTNNVIPHQDVNNSLAVV